MFEIDLEFFFLTLPPALLIQNDPLVKRIPSLRNRVKIRMCPIMNVPPKVDWQVAMLVTNYCKKWAGKKDKALANPIKDELPLLR